jgi:hypothetical protein
MKVAEIEDLNNGKYKLLVKRSFMGRLFTSNKYFSVVLQDSGREYTVGSQTIYIDSEGNRTSNGSYLAEAIDKYRRKKSFGI